MNTPITILVADDDPLLRMAAKRTLEAAGYQTLEAADGETALELARSHRPALILMDIDMPKQNGLEALQHIKSDPALAGVYVIIVSGTRVDTQSRVYGLNVGADGYLTRPIPNRELLAHVQSILRIKKAEDALREKERQLRDLIASNIDGMLVTDLEGRALFANPAALKMLNRSEQTLLGQPVNLPMDDPAMQELQFSDSQGGQRFVEMRAVKIEWKNQPAYLAALRDVTERKQMEARLEYLATHDGLTGLPNRRLFLDRLIQAMERNRRKHHTQPNTLLAVFMLDLDHFKQVNDTHGHKMGDQLLRTVAGRLSACLRETDTAARMGGDEFTVIAEDLASLDDCKTLAEKIRAHLAAPYIINGHTLPVTPSIGVSLHPLHGETIDALLANADKAMYRAKQTRNCFRFHADSNAKPSLPQEQV